MFSALYPLWLPGLRNSNYHLVNVRTRLVVSVYKTSLHNYCPSSGHCRPFQCATSVPQIYTLCNIIIEFFISVLFFVCLFARHFHGWCISQRVELLCCFECFFFFNYIITPPPLPIPHVLCFDRDAYSVLHCKEFWAKALGKEQ